MINYGNDLYSYDANNQRIRKIEGGENTYYIRGVNGSKVLAEYSTEDATPDAEYIYDFRGLFLIKDRGHGYLWRYTDHLGSLRQLVDEFGANSIMKRDYYPYGENKVSSGNESAYQFTSKELDNVSGLYYYGIRYYDPSIGRWYVPDPLAEKYPQWSPYVYALNNPLKLLDPDGCAVIELNWKPPTEEDIDEYVEQKVSEVKQEWSKGSKIKAIGKAILGVVTSVGMIDEASGGTSGIVALGVATKGPQVATKAPSAIQKIKQAISIFPQKIGGGVKLQPFNPTTGQFIEKSKTFGGKVTNLISKLNTKGMQFSIGFGEGAMKAETPGLELSPAMYGSYQKTGRVVGEISVTLKTFIKELIQ